MYFRMYDYDRDHKAVKEKGDPMCDNLSHKEYIDHLKFLVERSMLHHIGKKHSNFYEFLFIL